MCAFAVRDETATADSLLAPAAAPCGAARAAQPLFACARFFPPARRRPYSAAGVCAPAYSHACGICLFRRHIFLPLLFLIYNGSRPYVAAADDAEDVRRGCAGAGAGRRPRRPVAAQPRCIAKRNGGRVCGSFAGGMSPRVTNRSSRCCRQRALSLSRALGAPHPGASAAASAGAERCARRGCALPAAAPRRDRHAGARRRRGDCGRVAQQRLRRRRRARALGVGVCKE